MEPQRNHDREIIDIDPALEYETIKTDDAVGEEIEQE